MGETIEHCAEQLNLIDMYRDCQKVEVEVVATKDKLWTLMDKESKK